MRDTYTYEELKSLTVADLREIAKGLHHDVVQGYTQMTRSTCSPPSARRSASTHITIAISTTPTPRSSTSRTRRRRCGRSRSSATR